jgi:hypothetical protein
MSSCNKPDFNRLAASCLADLSRLVRTSFPGLSYEDEGRDEKALVWVGHVTTRKMAVFDSYSSRSGAIFFKYYLQQCKLVTIFVLSILNISI